MLKHKCVILLLYDLPVDTAAERKKAVRFRSRLLKEGFTILQRSAYIKIVNNASASNSEIQQVKKYAPDTGLIQALSIPLSIFNRMVNISGGGMDMELCSADMIIV